MKQLSWKEAGNSLENTGFPNTALLNRFGNLCG
jgi:thermostable 8-oxoguanine DNA glycosylase